LVWGDIAVIEDDYRPAGNGRVSIGDG
jgi:hypothetical protein